MALSSMYSEKLNHLHNLLKSMDLPSFRKSTETIDGLRWLYNNLHVKNSEHNKYDEAKSLIFKILDENNCKV